MNTHTQVRRKNEERMTGSYEKEHFRLNLLRLLGYGRCVENLTSPFMSSTAMMSLGPLFLTLLVLQKQENRQPDRTENKVQHFAVCHVYAKEYRREMHCCYVDSPLYRLHVV